MAVFNLLHNKGIRGNLQLLSICRKLNRRACHQRRGIFCLLEFRNDECIRQSSPYDRGPISSYFTVMFRLLRSNRNIGPFVWMFLVLRLCLLCKTAGLSGGVTAELRSDSLAARRASFYMFLVLRLSLLFRNAGLSRWGNSRTTEWFLGCILAFRAAAPTRPAATFFGSLALLV